MGLCMTFQMVSDRVNSCGLVTAKLNMFKADLRNRQGEGKSEEPQTEEIFPTATMMILLWKRELAKNSFIIEPRAWQDSSGNRLGHYRKTSNEESMMDDKDAWYPLMKLRLTIE